MEPHFQFTVTLGNLTILLTLFGMIGGFARWAGSVKVLLLEHDMMWRDYKVRKGINGEEADILADHRALINALAYKAKAAKAGKA